MHAFVLITAITIMEGRWTGVIVGYAVCSVVTITIQPIYYSVILLFPLLVVGRALLTKTDLLVVVVGSPPILVICMTDTS